MKSEKTFFKLPKIISLISIFILLVWNNFSIYAFLEWEVQVLNTDIVNLSDDDNIDKTITLKRIDSFFGGSKSIINLEKLVSINFCLKVSSRPSLL